MADLTKGSGLPYNPNAGETGSEIYTRVSPTGLPLPVKGTDNGDGTSSLSVSGGGGGTQYAEGATQATATGTAVFAKKPSNVLAMLNLDSSGNLLTAVTGAGSGGTSSADKATWTAGTTAGTPMMAAFDDASPSSVSEDQVGVVRMSANRNQYSTLRDAAGNERGANVNASNQLSVSVDNTVTVASHAVTNAGTFAVQANGGVASGASDTTNPIKVGARYNATKPTFSDGQLGDLQIGTRGSLMTTLVVNDSATVVQAAADNADAVAVSSTNNKISIVGRNTVFNGTTWDRMSGDTTGISIKDNGNSITVDNGGTFATQAAQSGTWNITNVSGTVSLPTGASTAAKQPALGTAGTASSDVITVQGIASMTPLLVTATLAAGATAIGKAEDSASANADVGVPAMAIQTASPADTAGTDLDYSMLQMSAGRLWASVKVDTALPSGANVIGHVITDTGSTTVVTGTVTVGTHAVTVASGGIASGAIASGAVASGAFASGSIGSGAIASGAIASGAVASGAFASGSIAAGAVAAGATSFVKLEDVASADADAGVPAMAIRKASPANTSGTDGDYEMLQMSAGRLWASAVLESGSTTAVTQATASNLNAQVVGTVADGASDAGNSVKVGYIGHTALPSAVTDAQRISGMADKFGRQIVVPALRDLVVDQNTTITASTSETTIFTAVASTFLDITQLTITNSSATATTITIRESTAGTTRMILDIGARGGIVITPPVPITQGTVNNNWTAQCGTSVSSIHIYAQAVKNK